MRKFFALTLALVLTLGAGTAAMAAWDAIGAGHAYAQGDQVPAPTTVVAAASESTVTVEWSPVTMSGGTPVDGYRITRDGTTAGGSCGDYVDPADHSCSEDELANGTYVYRVAARVGDHWVSGEGETHVTVDVSTAQEMSTSIQLTADKHGPGQQWTAHADIRVVDESGNPVSGAHVVSSWGDCTTGADGWCTTRPSEGGNAEKERTLTITSVSAPGFQWTGTEQSAAISRS